MIAVVGQHLHSETLHTETDFDISDANVFWVQYTAIDSGLEVSFDMLE